MPFSPFDDETHKLLREVFDGAMIILEVMHKDALSDERRPETIARVTSQLIAAAAEGHRDFQMLQLEALDGIE